MRKQSIKPSVVFNEGKVERGYILIDKKLRGYNADERYGQLYFVKPIDATIYPTLEEILEVGLIQEIFDSHRVEVRPHFVEKTSKLTSF